MRREGVDAFVTNRHSDTPMPNLIFMNLGKEPQARETEPTQCRKFDSGDVDRDHDIDLILDLDSGPGIVLLNDGHGNFKSGGTVGTSPGQYTALGDLDGDGDLDAFIGVDEGELGNQVWLNQWLKLR